MGPYTDLRMNRVNELNDLRDLLEANLATLHTLVQLQARKLKSLEQTRALLYVALRELIVGNDNEPTRA